MTLKEILQERRRAASAPVEPHKQPDTDNQVIVVNFDCFPPRNEYHAMFDGCEDF